MEKIQFVNGTTPALNSHNLNQLQTNMENAFFEYEEYNNIVSRTSGASITSSKLTKIGGICQLTIKLRTSGSTSAGSNVFNGTLNSNYLPHAESNSSTYNGSCGVNCYLDTDGEIICRVISGTMATDKEITFSYIYILD